MKIHFWWLPMKWYWWKVLLGFEWIVCDDIRILEIMFIFFTVHLVWEINHV